VPVRFSLEDSGMWYSNGTITINPYSVATATKGWIGSSILHELVHHYTIESLLHPITEADNTLLSTIDQLYDFYRNDVFKNEDSKGDFYGLTDNMEFASEIITNSRFKDELMKHAVYNSNNTIIDSLKSIINKIANLLHIKPLFETIESSKLEELLDNINKVIDEGNLYGTRAWIYGRAAHANDVV